jgi:hypothetical protein
MLLDSQGNLVLSIPLPEGGPRFFDLSYDHDLGEFVLVSERGGKRRWQVPSTDGILIGLLLPAVQKDGSSAGMLAGSVQVGGPNGIIAVVPFSETTALHVRLPPPRNYFVGPFTLTQGEPAQLGMLLPAVQKVREAARFQLVNGDGRLIAEDVLAAPPERQSGPFGVQYDLLFGDGSVRVQRRMADGSVRVGEGTTVDGILIGLLLPAVHAGGAAADFLGGSLQMGTVITSLEGGFCL